MLSDITHFDTSSGCVFVFYVLKAGGLCTKYSKIPIVKHYQYVV